MEVLTRMKVDLSCPIELWEYELPTAENPAYSFTFFNLGERTIASIQITITFLDANDEVLSRRVERPMALDAPGREPFVVELPAEDKPTEAIDLTIDKAWFEDGTEWRRQQDVRLVDYEPNELPPNRKLEQLRYIAGKDAVGFPSDQGNVWICICGRVNAAEEWHCRRCDREKEEVFALYSPEAVQGSIDEREQELEDKARGAREEASRQEFMRQDKIRRRKRSRRTRTIIICAVVVVAVLSYLFVVLGLPELRYQTAVAAMQAGDTAQARQTFEKLGNYRDAKEMVSKADLTLASEYLSSGDRKQMDEAVNILRNLGDYPGAAEMAEDAAYQIAMYELDIGAYDEAARAFTALGDYRDASDMVKESGYRQAKDALESGEYDAAETQFAALGNYLDAAALAKEAVYQPAAALVEAGNYNEAAKLFAEIPGYKDADDQRLQSLYQDALRAQLAGDPEYAAEQFQQLGDYEDSPEQVKQSIYLAANSARDSGKYEMALKLYETIPGYEDADEQRKLCAYLPAKQMIDEGRYEQAIVLLETIPGYEDADELLMQARYLPAKEAIEAGEYDQAIALLEEIPGYQDADKLLQQAQYAHAEQRETSGQLELAAEAFETLGSYSDAAERAQAARYAWAEEALAAGQFKVAAERFEALGRYKDAQERLKECAFELAMLLYNNGDMKEAYEAFDAINDYAPATEMAQKSAYAWGEKLTHAGDLLGAADAFGLAGRYEDAVERRQDNIYQEAEKLLEDGDAQGAGALFDSISGYTDADEKRDAAYDQWLAESSETAQTAYDAGEYQAVVDALVGLDMDTLPRAYANLKTMYQDANLKIARELIAEDRALDAYGYLLAAGDYRNAASLLEKNIYRILGTWESDDGERYAFYLNGTAWLNGDEVYFNMFTPYGISAGETSDPQDMQRVLNYSSGNANALQLREEGTDRIIRLKRVRPPEISQTDDSDGSLVIPDEEQAGRDTPIVDTITVDGTVEMRSPLDRDTDEGTTDVPADETEETEGTP